MIVINKFYCLPSILLLDTVDWLIPETGSIFIYKLHKTNLLMYRNFIVNMLSLTQVYDNSIMNSQTVVTNSVRGDTYKGDNCCKY